MADHDPTEDQARDQGRKRASASSFVHFTDLWLTALILCICGWLYYITTGFEEVSALLAQNIGPEWFPRLLIWTIVVLSLMLPFEHLAKGSKTDSIDEDRSNRIKPISILTALLMLIVVGAVHLFGTLGGMIVVCVALPLLWGERRMKILVPYVLLFPPAVALLFTKVLKVYFEPGVYGIAIGG